MVIEKAGRAWMAPAASGSLVVAVFLALIAVNATLRQFWPLLVLSAAATAAPFLLRGTAVERNRPLPILPQRAPANTGQRPAALRVSAVTVPKASVADGENEDAFSIDARAGYAAIADGASSSFRAGEWARTLCRTFLVERPLDERVTASWIAVATAEFGAAAADTPNWWSAEASHRGAHAAFAGLAVLRSSVGLVWRATAVGDCVLAHLRPVAGAPPIVTAFPIAHSAAFPANPALLSSAVDGHPPIASIDGAAAVGDVWLLMTDELARLTLRRHESGEPMWTALLGDEARVRALIASARAAGEVVDDDMTVVRCEAVLAD